MTAKPGRTGVEYLDVVGAILALTAEGSKITLQAIRTNLGTGSLGTIQRHLAAYKVEQEVCTEVVEVTPEVTKFLRDWVSAAVSEAQSQQRQMIEVLQSELGVLATDNQRLTEERDAGLCGPLLYERRLGL